MSSSMDSPDRLGLTDRFTVRLEGLPEIDWVACRGLEGGRRFLEIREGGVMEPRRFPAGTGSQPLVLEGLLPPGSSFWSWLESAEAREATIEVLDGRDEVRARWDVHRARPGRWRAQDLDARECRPVMVVLELVHEGLRHHSLAAGGRADA